MNELRVQFEECLSSNNCVRVETFYIKLKEKNDIIKLSDKIDDVEKFTELINKPEDLEVFAEGYRCLSQIHINLIRDFDIFKEYPIRKYSSAFNYISKIKGFKDILNQLGYKDNDMKFELKVQKLENKDEVTEVALKQLICFMETMELYRLKFGGCRISDLIIKRDENIKKSKDKYEDKNMTDEDMIEKFKKCDICTEDVDDDGVCTICGQEVTEFSFAHRYIDFIQRRFPRRDIRNIKRPKEEEEKRNEPESKPKEPRGKLVIQKPKEVKKNDTWACKDCTFVNDSSAFNCSICGGVDR